MTHDDEFSGFRLAVIFLEEGRKARALCDAHRVAIDTGKVWMPEEASCLPPEPSHAALPHDVALAGFVRRITLKLEAAEKSP